MSKFHKKFMIFDYTKSSPVNKFKVHNDLGIDFDQKQCCKHLEILMKNSPVSFDVFSYETGERLTSDFIEESATGNWKYVGI